MNLKPLVLAVSTVFIMACDDDDEHADGGLDAGVSTALGLKQTNLVADQAGAAYQDPLLINGWGLAFGPSGVAWVVSNGGGTVRLYDASGAPNATLAAVTVPVPMGGAGPSAPTGVVANGDPAAFQGDAFIIVTEDGTIKGWQSKDGATAILKVDRSAGADHAVYKGVTIATSSGGTRLYAADFHNNRIDVFDANYAPVTLPSGFVDANLPAGYAPFNVRALGSKIYVTYAMQDAARKDDVPGAGNGYVDTYDENGGSQARLISGAQLNAPWGLAVAPGNFGDVSGDLLVGNFGDGRINAFNPTTGSFVATMTNLSGTPLSIDGLWALAFGGGQTGEAQNQLFFTAGPGNELHGLFGRLDMVQFVVPTNP